MNFLALTIVFACFVACLGVKARYDNYRVYSIEVENEQQLEVLKDFESGRDGISFLKTPTGIQQTAEIIVPPHKFADIGDLFEEQKLKNHVKIANLQKLIDEEQPKNLDRSGFGWKQYNELGAIYAWLDDILKKYPKVLTNYTYGKSYEKRPLRAVKVSHKKGNPTIFIESTIHAREWITAATATYFLNELLTSDDVDIRKLADNYDWVFVPVVNVDGYVYAHSKDRMWRKTRKPSPKNKRCVGVDANRNFDSHHGEVGASTDPCSEIYAGPTPFSEPETLALSKFIKSFDNIKLYLSFHSYSQLLLFPYGYTKQHAKNHKDLNQIGQKTKQAIAKRYGTQYKVGNTGQAIYLASGGSDDWVYDSLNVLLSYTFEFRDTGRYGFVLPANQIIPNSLEVIDGLKAMIKEAKSLGQCRGLILITKVLLMKLITVAILFACFVACLGEKARYDNYRVYSIEVENEQQLEVLRDFESGRDGISFLETPTGIQQTAEIIVPPHKFADIGDLFEEQKLKNHVKIANLQTLIDEEQPENLERSGFGWKQYYDLTAIYAWLDELLEQYPNVLSEYNYGTSYENRTLRALKVSHKKGNPTIFIESTIHAREWVTVATATYILNELLTSDDAEIRKLADSYDWVFVPVTNVDGYQYTHSKDRMWRKTRKPNPSSTCVGADPNRNFDFHHAEVGASTNPCAETYAGPTPFSEPEILALSKFIKSFDNIKLYISFHSYSQLLLFSYGHSKEHTPNHNDLNQIGLKTKQAIAQRYKTQYRVGSIAEAIYLASGSSIDWVYGTQNVSLTYTFEFRDKGRYGFLLPANQIIPNSLEVIDGLKAMVAEAKALQYL
ncbi:uncharacterized protein LOC129572592 [Sitodiplosis mosellana]|uniref:uncharacterized protein LOC129572592 n=1 Tax=Sitodiplosis mosellana TaxID=263140 RepID=UPI002444810E|nr:uncharacterized protein LOC129572592 [Sitodiplosis mosellana]